MKKGLLFFVVLLIFTISINIAFAQGKKKQTNKSEKDAYEFTMVYQVKTTPVKNQAKTGTCWSFATTSFIETELIRMGKGIHILSPMYFVRYAYPQKAENYIRYSGTNNFSNGGQAHDVMNIIKEFGFVPEEVYDGKKIEEEEHNHGEMDEVLKAITNAVNKNKGGKITPRWKDVFESTLDIYLGKPPKEFNYLGRKFTPTSFRDSLGFNPENYLEFTSYTHHPFYEKFVLEVPDNWNRGEYYNIPINDLIQLIDSSLAKGYSVCWDGDTSEKTFNRKKGIAIIPQKEETDDEAEKENEDEENEKPIPEKFITQEMRQNAFDNQTTTDDHLMHIVGLAKDNRGYKFYYVKNSWGTNNKKYDGYIYMSEIYARLKTIAIMVHKDAVPERIKNKLGIK